MQIVIIAGGLATRLRPISLQISKSMIDVAGKPFLQYQIELLKKHDIKDIVLCVGHLSEQIENYFGSGQNFGVNIQYSYEKEELLGTGGALKQAAKLLQNDFFVMWGDSYLLLDYQDIWNSYKTSNYESLMVVYKNYNQGDKSNVLVQDNKVILYDKWSSRSDLIYIDNGLSILNKKILEFIPDKQVFALENIFKQLAFEQKIYAYITEQKFYEIGSFSGLENFKKLVSENNL
ncbi:MAG: sugar phosphate nucleotidyltransferase [Candidatus Babeliales bacterium]